MRVGFDRTVTVGGEVLANFVLPYVIYVWLQPDYGDVPALMGAAAPPAVLSLVGFARTRRLDAISLIVLFGILLSLLAFIGSGSARFLQLRENLVSGVVGFMFLGSAVIGRPLIYVFALAGSRRTSMEDAARLEALRGEQGFRRGMMLMTLVWGFGLLIQMGVLCAMALTMTIPHYLLVSPFVGYGILGVLALWSVVYLGRMRRV